MKEVKKLTKKERNELEAQIAQKRFDFVHAVEDYRNDCQAAKEYLSTKGEYVSDEEYDRLFGRYEALKDYQRKYDKDSSECHMWNIIDIIVNNYKNGTVNDKESQYLTTNLGKDDLLVKDILWGLADVILLIQEAHKYGYKRIFYMDNSTAAMDVIGQFIELGAKIEKSVLNTRFNMFGIIINIEEAIYSIGYIEDEEVINEIEDKLKSLGDNIQYSYREEDVRSGIIKKYSDTYGILKIWNTYERSKNKLINKLKNKREGE